MKRVLALVGLTACGCSAADRTCLTNYFAAAAGYIATKIPLNTQSSCAGASSVPLQTDPQDFGAGPAGVCAVEPSDTACLACLREACCVVVAEACGAEGDAADPATCAAVPDVKSCILDAAIGNCAAACSADAGAP